MKNLATPLIECDYTALLPGRICRRFCHIAKVQICVHVCSCSLSIMYLTLVLSIAKSFQCNLDTLEFFLKVPLNWKLQSFLLPYSGTFPGETKFQMRKIKGMACVFYCKLFECIKQQLHFEVELVAEGEELNDALPKQSNMLFKMDSFYSTEVHGFLKEHDPH